MNNSLFSWKSWDSNPDGGSNCVLVTYAAAKAWDQTIGFGRPVDPEVWKACRVSWLASSKVLVYGCMDNEDFSCQSVHQGLEPQRRGACEQP